MIVLKIAAVAVMLPVLAALAAYGLGALRRRLTKDVL